MYSVKYGILEDLKKKIQFKLPANTNNESPNNMNDDDDDNDEAVDLPIVKDFDKVCFEFGDRDAILLDGSDPVSYFELQEHSKACFGLSTLSSIWLARLCAVRLPGIPCGGSGRNLSMYEAPSPLRSGFEHGSTSTRKNERRCESSLGKGQTIFSS